MGSATTCLATLRIVVVENDLSLRRFLVENLETLAGHEVVGEAATGTDMVRTVLALEPDVVVFDLHLPGCNGLEALRQIYQEHGVAAVAITGDRDRELVRPVLEEYDLTYLVKPVEAHQLEPAVLAAWARFDRFRQLRDENASLRQTLDNRKLIERAKGILMKKHRWSEDEAYRRLQRGAMNGRTTMAQLAQAVLNGEPLDLQPPAHSGSNGHSRFAR